MGHKTHPYGFRLGIVKDWKAHWFAPTASSYRTLVLEDIELRRNDEVFLDALGTERRTRPQDGLPAASSTQFDRRK